MVSSSIVYANSYVALCATGNRLVEVYSFHTGILVGPKQGGLLWSKLPGIFSGRRPGKNCASYSIPNLEGGRDRVPGFF